MERGAPVVSVVIPTYNEARRIGATLEDGHRYLQRLGLPYEVIVVDNASTDGTPDVIGRLGLPATRVIVERSRGKGSAIRRGVLESRGEFVLLLDADNATPVSELDRVWPLWRQGIQIVIGSRY